MENVGFVGLGTMGLPMAVNLIRAGYTVTVYDLRESAVERAVAEGARRAESVGELSRTNGIVVTMLPDVPEVEAVMTGQDGILENARSATIVIEMSTIHPDTTRKLADYAKTKGIRFLDAPVCRSSKDAENGTLLILVGGEEADLEAVRGLLDTMGSEIEHCGPVGSGITLKLINNTLVQGIAVALNEALILTEKSGISIEALSSVCSRTAASNRLLEKAYPNKVFKNDYSLGFALDWATKDVGHTVSLAKSLGVDPKVGVVALHWLKEAQRAGLGRQDAFVISKYMSEQ